MPSTNKYAESCVDCGERVEANAGRLYRYSGCNIPTRPARYAGGPDGGPVLGRKRIWSPKQGQKFVYKVRCAKCVRARGDDFPGDEPTANGSDYTSAPCDVAARDSY